MVASIVEKLYADLKKVIGLIPHNEADARAFFNRHVYPRYKDALDDTNGPLSSLSFFLFELDEFLNNQNARHLGQSTKNKIIGSFHSDFQDDLKEAYEKEKGAR